MKFLLRTAIAFLIQAVALTIAARFVSGFEIASGLKNLLLVTAIFTALNLFVRPFVKLLLSPLIILTLGLGLIIVNALMLFILDLLSQSLTIQGTLPLILAALIISGAHIIAYVLKKTV